jgi:hypothetical protein
MADLVPAIYVFLSCKKDVDARDKAGMTADGLVRHAGQSHLLSGGFRPSTGGSDFT